jgi:predicted dinucleotide-binding enzyme
MKIAVVGKGNVGGGLADRWERAGHDVTRIGKDGGDVSDADAVLIAVPGGALTDAIESVSGWEGKTVIDATNLIGAEPPGGFSSNAEFVKSKTNGPTAKSFNLNLTRHCRAAQPRCRLRACLRRRHGQDSAAGAGNRADLRRVPGKRAVLLPDGVAGRLLVPEVAAAG